MVWPISFFSNEEVVINTSTNLLIFFYLFLISSFAQDNSKYDELNKRVEVLSKQLENCGSDLKCIQETSKKLQQAIKEVQALHKTDPYITGETTSDDFLNELPSLEGEFPPEFQKLMELWLKHELASTKDLKLNCDNIENTKNAVMDEIAKVYKERGPFKEEWPLPVHDCNKTYVNLMEHGTLNEPETYYLNYSLELTDEAVWTVDYAVLIGKKPFNYYDNYSFRLGLADSSNRKCRVTSFSGWIMGDLNGKPVQYPLNRYEIFERGVIEAGVQPPYNRNYTRIYPNNVIEDPKDKFPLLGKATEYKLLLPYQIVRFYSAENHELYVENTILLILLSEVTDEIFTPEEVQKFFQDGKFKKTYGVGDITQELEIGYPPLGCYEQTTSTDGAIVLNGDCIDHGGYVIASDTSMTVNGKPVARIGDKVICNKHGKTEIVASSKTELTVGKKPVARIGDRTKCGAQLLGGSMDAFAGNK
jgi:uncharacterized Zn-binding protein involved in type VI secretion